jgi:hypothetical protein
VPGTTVCAIIHGSLGLRRKNRTYVEVVDKYPLLAFTQLAASPKFAM